MSAAVDFLGPDAIEINRYQTEIVDLVRRRRPFGPRINQTLATPLALDGQDRSDNYRGPPKSSNSPG
jgi:hypothetical protein